MRPLITADDLPRDRAGEPETPGRGVVCFATTVTADRTIGRTRIAGLIALKIVGPDFNSVLSGCETAHIEYKCDCRRPAVLNHHLFGSDCGRSTGRSRSSGNRSHGDFVITG